MIFLICAPNLAGLMKPFLYIIVGLLSFTFYAQEYAEPDDQILDTIQINGYGNKTVLSQIPKTVTIIKLDKLQQQALETLDDVLKLVAGADIRSRGAKGVQSDISIRGGNFDQVLILLNGIKVNNPQTGHHSLDLPVDLSMLDHIEIIEGSAGQSFGVNAYAGVINLVTKNPKKEQAQTGLKIGQYSYLKTDFDLSHSLGNLAVYNGFSYQRSDGYLTNEKINNTDFYAIKDFVHIHLNLDKLPVDIQAGYHQKDFGANSFYTSKYPWQYEKTHGYFASVQTSFGHKINWKPSISYKLHYDEFQLFRESIYHYTNGYYVHEQDTAQYAPGFYYKGHNYHKTQQISATVNMQYRSKLGITNAYFAISDDRIWSNVLGTNLNKPIVASDRITYTKGSDRTYLESHFNQTKQIKNFNVGAGINLLYSPDYEEQITGGGFINYQKNHFTYYASLNTASRLPSFTDLYYQGPTNIGNPDLQPETSISYELGAKYHHKKTFATVSGFYRKSNNTIDWIKYNLTDKWQPQNLTQLHTYGLEASIKHRFQNKFAQQLIASYAYLNMDKANQMPFVSKYALDYLKHKLSVQFSHYFFWKTTIHWTGIYKDRAGQYIDYVNEQYQLFDYKPYFLTHVKINKQFKKTRIALSIENLFDTIYNDLSYIKMPGRWVIFELSYKVK